MKTCSAELAALLNTVRIFRMADCYTIATVDGVVLRYTNLDVDVQIAGNTFSSRGPLVSRGPIRTMTGLEVDTLALNIATANPAHVLNGQPFISAALDGALDGATVLLQRAFFEAWGEPAVDALTMFSGRVGPIDGGRHELQIMVKSDLELLNAKLPRNLYTPGCGLTVYTTPCGANKAAKTVAGTVTSVASARTSFSSALGQADGWFDTGRLTFTSGPNAGVSRTVRAFADGSFDFALAWPADVAVGQAFSVYPGCFKSKADCRAKHNNLARFRGFPFIPSPETMA